MFRRPVLDKKMRETVKHVIGPDLSGNYDLSGVSGVMVDNGQKLDCPSVVCPFHHKIIRADMVGMSRPETDTGAVIKP